MRKISIYTFLVLSVSSIIAQDSLKLTIYPTIQRELKNGVFVKNTLDRSKYFSTMGMLSGNKYSDEEWNDRLPMRNVGPNLSTLEENCYNGIVFDEEVEGAVDHLLPNYAQGFADRPGLKWAIAGNERTYPTWMRESSDMHKPVINEYADIAALHVSSWLRALESYDVPLPSWYTAENEPTTSWPIQDIAKFHISISENIKSKYPGVHVMGPCWAWTWPGENLDTWRSLFADFIQYTENRLDGFDLHIYSKGYWAYNTTNYQGNPNDMSLKQDHPSLFEGMYSGNENVYEFGVLQSQLNMIQAVQTGLYNDGPKEVIISEYGRQSIAPQFGPWENDFKFFLYMTTVIRQMMIYMDYPEIQLAVPFIVAHSQANYAPERGQAVYNYEGDPSRANYSPTRFVDFYNYLSDLKGDRLKFESFAENKTFSEVEVLRDGNVIYIMVHYGKTFGEYDLNLETVIDGAGEENIASVSIKRMIWQGNYPEPHDDPSPLGDLLIETDYTPVISLSDINLTGEETAIIKIELNEVAEVASKVIESVHYADDYLQVIDKASGFSTDFDLSDLPSNLENCEIDIGLSVKGGLNNSPTIIINGESLGHVMQYEHTTGIDAYNSVETINIPVEYLKNGTNTLKLMFNNESSMNNIHFVSGKLRMSYVQ